MKDELMDSIETEVIETENELVEMERDQREREKRATAAKAKDAMKKKAKKQRIPRQFCGIDEAGRGALIGPLVIGSVVLTKKAEKQLLEAGVKDSKKLSAKRREQLYVTIKNVATHAETLHITASDIDSRRECGENLNQIELLSMFQLVYRVGSKVDTVSELILDSIEANPKKWSAPFKTLFKPTKITAENGADNKFVSVGAASILAKVERDRAVAELSEKLKIPLGSGYPSDPNVKRHVDDLLQEYNGEAKSLPSYIRHTWKMKQLKKEQRGDSTGGYEAV